MGTILVDPVDLEKLRQMAEAGLDLAERENALLGCSVHLPHWRRLLSEIQRIERSSSAPKRAASSNPS